MCLWERLFSETHNVSKGEAAVRDTLCQKFTFCPKINLHQFEVINVIEDDVFIWGHYSLEATISNLYFLDKNIYLTQCVRDRSLNYLFLHNFGNVSKKVKDTFREIVA